MKRTVLLFSVILSMILLSLPVVAHEVCSVHSNDYHTIDGQLIQYVGDGSFEEWKKKVENLPGEDGCPFAMNIYRFIHELEIPQTVFADIICTHGFWNYDYPVELLYSTDAETVDTYYRNWQDREDLLKIKNSNLWMRLKLMHLATEMEEYRIFYDKYHREDQLLAYSTADFVRVTGIAKEDLQTLFRSWETVEYSQYDFDLLYELAKEPEKTTPLAKVNEDLLFCGLPVIEETVYASPQTGDNTQTAAVVCIISALLLLITIPAIRKRRK
ncbi:MAG: hypothetical protein IJ325_13980 [Clostridia bacterium]|nr:hypothetical protein [Clostridia bacterium]MBQ7923661.1 hypothetical protein [Clostridia bacterium]